MSGSKVVVLSTHIIKPVSCFEFEQTALSLTPSDLELLHSEYSQKGLLYRKPYPQNESTSNNLVLHLKQSLERTLSFFPPLLGRLLTTPTDDGEGTFFFVDSTNAGAIFIHATLDDDADLTVADIIDPSSDVPEIVHLFFPMTGIRNYEGVTQPLLAVQVTELLDGLFLGCSINHLLVDGTSFWHFFNSWAEISRSQLLNNGDTPLITSPISISKQPVFNRDIFAQDLMGCKNVKILNEYLVPYSNVANHDCSLKERVFTFTSMSVAKLKTKANQEMEESNGKISSLQAIIAHVWRSILRCRPETYLDVQETTFIIPMGARHRIIPPVADEYFGNVVFPGHVTLDSEKILENGLGWTALQINRMVNSCSGYEQVKDFFMDWVKKPEFLNFDEIAKNEFVLINSPRFDVYGNDFGWGKPVAVRSGKANRYDGRITVSSGVEKGSLEIEVCLCQESLSALCGDAEFMEFVQLN